jgi:hypothetical protein
MIAARPGKWAGALSYYTPNSLFKRLLIPYLLTVSWSGHRPSTTSCRSIYRRPAQCNVRKQCCIFDLVESLGEVQTYTESYLSTKSSTALENYYRASDNLNEKAALLNDEIFDAEPLLLERNIRRMSDSYNLETQSAIQAKRGRDMAAYPDHYNPSTQIYEYIILYATS